MKGRPSIRRATALELSGLLAAAGLGAACGTTATGPGDREAWPPGGSFVPAEPQAPPLAGAGVGPEAGEVGRSGDVPALELSLRTEDPTYGWTSENPVPVGASEGPRGLAVRRFLNALWGPDGQPIEHRRRGSCPGGAAGSALEVHAISFEGVAEPLLLYVDALRPGQLRIPVGLSAGPASGR